MMYTGRLVLILLLLVFTNTPIFSQYQTADTIDKKTEVPTVISGESDSLFTIRKVYFDGNKKTKQAYMFREMPFKEGDQMPLSELVLKFEVARRQLMNTTLFHEVVVSLKGIEGYDVDIKIEVKERWYLFPLPFFKFVDRNFNQWLVEQNAKLDRVNYGLKVLYNNTTGNNDKLNIWLMNGYTKQILLSYDRPYIDKKMKFGLNTSLALGKNREINYTTLYDKQQFFKDTNNYVRSFLRANMEVTYRKAIKTRHRFGISYNSENITDTIISLNPSFFKSNKNRIVFPEFYYAVNYTDVDYNPFPLKGYMAEVFLLKRGFNSKLNLWQLSVKTFASWKMATKTYFGLKVSGIVKLPFSQPFFNKQLLGYGDFFMQGYEYYVVDGVVGGYVKTSITREVLNFYLHAKKKNKEDLFRIPFKIYAKVFANAGYVHNPSPGLNDLNNKMLYSGGFGLEILTHYDFTLKLEWSFNQLGQNGLYLHRKSFY